MCTMAPPVHPISLSIFRDDYKDEYTNGLLPSAWVREAIFDELDHFNKNVWTVVPESVARSDPDAKLIGTRFIINNKGDVHQPDVRARLVAQEVGDGPDSSFYAATPPLMRRNECSFRNVHLKGNAVARSSS